MEELLHAQRNDKVWAEIRRLLNKRERSSFDVDDSGIPVRMSYKGIEIVAPHSRKERILYINHHSKLDGHTSGPKMYRRIRMDFYWSALEVDC